MTADEVMSEQVRLEALERHIQEALKREGLPYPTAAHFRAHLARVRQAREALLAVATDATRLGFP